MEITLELDNSTVVQLQTKSFQEMIILFNAINDGWTINKIDRTYVFSKRHENKKEIFHEDYLATFLSSYLSLPKV